MKSKKIRRKLLDLEKIRVLLPRNKIKDKKGLLLLPKGNLKNR